MAKVSVAVVLSVMLLISLFSVSVVVFAEGEEQPVTVGQRVDSAVTGVTNAFNEHGGPNAVDTVSSTFKSVYGWFGAKAKLLRDSGPESRLRTHDSPGTCRVC
ncbi:unnamed protein product [Microthlaspi erraticum]|uniref:Uncharacterized protein n=1 Tax=Microthlaspi erraticum TaxID=1685480 RepID=A0A6D2HGY1_9BRAS|nr:unnamed protein product [Microthlaspi erraticum]